MKKQEISFSNPRGEASGFVAISVLFMETDVQQMTSMVCESRERHQ